MEIQKNLKTFAPFRETVPELSARETLEGLFSPAMSGGRWWRENFGSRESSSPPPFPEHVLPKRCLVNKSFQIPHCQEHYDCGRTLKGTMKSKSKLPTTEMGHVAGVLLPEVPLWAGPHHTLAAPCGSAQLNSFQNSNL